jgi:threonine synthase
MDIQVSSNFERLLFDAYARDPAPVRALMGSLAQSRQIHHRATALTEIRSRFTAERADEDGDRATFRTGAGRRRPDLPARSHTAGAVRSPRRNSRDAACRWSV